MNGLSEFLIDSMVKEQTTALFGGGFKPPTKGHLEVVLQGLSENPKVNKLIIAVGKKNRGGVTQDQSVQIWEVYKRLIPVETEIIPVISPFNFYKKFLKENKEDNVYVFIGARKNNKKDIIDIKERSKFVKRYSDNVIPKGVLTENIDSGTNSRKLFKENLEKFYDTLPIDLTEDEKFQVHLILEGEKLQKYVDKVKGGFKKFIQSLKQEKQETKDAFKLLVQSVKGKKQLSKEEKKEIGNQMKDVLKVAGFTAASVLPGGVIYLMLSRIPALKKSLTPSAFINEASEDKILYAFDLDDTLITSKSNVIVTNPEQGTFKLTPAEYALYEPGPNDELDFSEFKYLKSPKVIKDNFELFSKILEKSSQLSGAKTIILTARQPEVATDVEAFLEKKNLPQITLHAVGSSDPNEKLEVIKDYINQGFNKIRFYDDSPKNVESIRSIDMPGVDVISKLVKHGPLGEVLLREAMVNEEKLDLNLPEDILHLYRAFIKNGKKLYVVGGAVRDALLGKDPKDYDLATDATPDEVLAIAEKEGLKTLEIGKQFGVVMVNGHEIATFRKDIGKGRRPDSVEYTDIEGDVNRRDLTINALFYDIDKGEVVDLVGGVQDLKDRKIRTVGKASERFEEDALRKLRALRFHGQTGGELGKETLQALKDNPSLEGVSGERIRDEFLKGLKKAISTKKYLETADGLGYLNQILPNLTITTPYIDEEDYIVLLAYLLKQNSPSQIVKQLNQLKYSGEEAKQISFLASLANFTPNQIQSYKKFQKISGVTDEQINKIGNLVGKDFTKFLNFELSVRGNEAPSGLKGPEIGDWVNKQEISNYQSLNEDNDPFGLVRLVNEVIGEDEFDYTPHIDSLNGYMEDKGMNVTPLPSLVFIHDDVDNAQDVMGKTAFYNPNKREIVLYTLYRHPKDVLRSYAHEMIHHIQNLEDRLGNITTTDTREDDHLTDIEREAYTDGNLAFRKWTETLTESQKSTLSLKDSFEPQKENYKFDCNCG